jgi:cardiolipin synthase
VEAADGEVRTGWAGVLTWPNLVTLLRFALVPVFVWLLFGDDDRLGAAIVLSVLGATDWIDGWLARRIHQHSVVGKVLDPTADRITLGVAMVAMLVDGSVPRWVAWLVLVREVLVSVVVLGLAAAGAARIDVQWVGKAGTFMNMFAFPLFLFSAATSGVASDVWRVLAWICVAPGLVLSWYAAATYLPLARGALRDGRAARQHGSP